MKRIVGVLVLVAAVVAVSSRPVRAEGLDEVKKQISAKMKKLTSISYKMKMTSETNDPNISTKTTSEGSIEYMRKGDKTMSRTEMTTKMVMKMGENETKNDSKIMTVDDGEFVYHYSEAQGQKQAMKQKHDPATSMDIFDSERLFKEQEKMFNVKSMPDETVDGKPCWVLEMTPKDPSMAYMGKTVAYYDKESGVGIKTVMFDTKGKQTGVMNISDLKVNGEIPADHFKFTAPPGVEVHDNTKQ